MVLTFINLKLGWNTPRFMAFIQGTLCSPVLDTSIETRADSDRQA